MYLTENQFDKIHIMAVCQGCSFSEGAIEAILAKHDDEIRLAARYYNESSLEKYVLGIVMNYTKVKAGRFAIIRSESDTKSVRVDKVLGDIVYIGGKEYGIEMLTV